MNKDKQLSLEFSKIIREWLTPEELVKVNKLNRTNPEALSGSICHTHDFCDANQAMIDAMELCGIEWIFAPETRDPDYDNVSQSKDRQGQMIDRAWNLAKANGFKGIHDAGHGSQMIKGEER